MMAVFFLALVASSVLAWGPGYGRGAAYGPNGCGCAISNLTPEQTSVIHAVQQANLKDISQLQQQTLATKTELRQLWPAKDPDQARINTLQKDVLDLQRKLQEKKTNVRFETRKVLTPGQQAQLTAYRPGIGYGNGRMRGRMGRW